MASPRKRRQGERLVDVIERIPIAIPYVCYHPQLGAIQTCDNCMVEVNGALVRACATVTADGMAVHTTSQKATAVGEGGEHRRGQRVAPLRPQGHGSPRRYPRAARDMQPSTSRVQWRAQPDAYVGVNSEHELAASTCVTPASGRSSPLTITTSGP